MHKYHVFRFLNRYNIGYAYLIKKNIIHLLYIELCFANQHFPISITQSVKKKIEILTLTQHSSLSRRWAHLTGNVLLFAVVAL